MLRDETIGPDGGPRSKAGPRRAREPESPRVDAVNVQTKDRRTKRRMNLSKTVDQNRNEGLRRGPIIETDGSVLIERGSSLAA